MRANDDSEGGDRIITMNPDGRDQRTLVTGFSIGAAERSPRQFRDRV